MDETGQGMEWMKKWKRRTVWLWAAVLLLIGTKYPAPGGIQWTRAVESEPVKKEFAGPVLLGMSAGPVLPSAETGNVLPSAETGNVLPSAETETVLPSAETGMVLPSAGTEAALLSAETGAVYLSAEIGTGLPSADAEAVLPSAETEPELAESTEPMESAEADAEEPAETVEQPELVTENGPGTDEARSDPLKILGDNPEKRLFLFGDADWGRRQVYETEEEAASRMADIDVPVWTLWKGVKSKGTMHVTVHKALAEDVSQIFIEIFNDPEQFPIESMGGFRYRTGTYGEHNNGTAIDLNADQNFQVRDGAALTGTCWEPGVNPYSIPEDGSVVRIFKAHGWSWGGDAWEEDADASAGYHDYMHFSYRGM